MTIKTTLESFLAADTDHNLKIQGDELTQIKNWHEIDQNNDGAVDAPEWLEYNKQSNAAQFFGHLDKSGLWGRYSEQFDKIGLNNKHDQLSLILYWGEQMKFSTADSYDRFINSYRDTVSTLTFLGYKPEDIAALCTKIPNFTGNVNSTGEITSRNKLVKAGGVSKPIIREIFRIARNIVGVGEKYETLANAVLPDLISLALRLLPFLIEAHATETNIINSSVSAIILATDNPARLIDLVACQPKDVREALLKNPRFFLNMKTAGVSNFENYKKLTSALKNFSNANEIIESSAKFLEVMRDCNVEPAMIFTSIINAIRIQKTSAPGTLNNLISIIQQTPKNAQLILFHTLLSIENEFDDPYKASFNLLGYFRAAVKLKDDNLHESLLLLETIKKNSCNKVEDIDNAKAVMESCKKFGLSDPIPFIRKSVEKSPFKSTMLNQLCATFVLIERLDIKLSPNQIQTVINKLLQCNTMGVSIDFTSLFEGIKVYSRHLTDKLNPGQLEQLLKSGDLPQFMMFLGHSADDIKKGGQTTEKLFNLCMDIKNKDGISLYGRYSLVILEAQKKYRGRGQETLIVTASCDWNGAFNNDYEDIEVLAKNNKPFSILETWPGEGRLYNFVREKYQRGEIKTVLWMGHGSKDGVEYSRGEKETNRLGFEDQNDWEKLTPYFAEGARIIFNACNVGRGNDNILNKFASWMRKVKGLTVIGCTEKPLRTKLVMNSDGTITPIYCINDENDWTLGVVALSDDYTNK